LNAKPKIQTERKRKLQDQHAIAIAIKSIALANRFRVGVQQKFAAGERADEHEQSRARQMKIREKRIDNVKFKRQVDKQIGSAFLRDELSIFATRRLQNADTCRADGD